MASVLASAFRAMEEPALARQGPPIWEARHSLNVERDGAIADGWTVSRWDAHRKVLVSSRATFQDLSPYFKARAQVAALLEGLVSPFDVRGTLEIERQRMQSVLADRVYGAYRFAAGDVPAVLSRATHAARADVEDFACGQRLVIRHDLLSMFAHPRLYNVPGARPLTERGDYDAFDSAEEPIEGWRSVALGPMDMGAVFGLIQGVDVHQADTNAGGRSPIVQAHSAGMHFLSPNGGQHWLRLSLDEPSQQEADVRHFFGQVGVVTNGLDGSIEQFAAAGWRVREAGYEAHDIDVPPPAVFDGCSDADDGGVGEAAALMSHRL
ncbi:MULTISPECIES: hypothetical protein [unclassified Burkholderia]|uniref:hypothetical protein n=1 Tax=unclassified Burkholderia TaxID=2613784 RepID=UPI002AB2158C|nr:MULTISPECIES: hypothetical protein [unclassified Burkholderia]